MSRSGHIDLLRVIHLSITWTAWLAVQRMQPGRRRPIGLYSRSTELTYPSMETWPVVTYCMSGKLTRVLVGHADLDGISCAHRKDQEDPAGTVSGNEAPAGS
jgi:hypothetical protein